MGWLRLVMVLVLLGRAIYTDMREGIIENQNVYFGLVSGCIWSAVYSGIEGVSASIKMIVITLLVLFVLFIVKWLGAGDIKLFCVLAAFYPEHVLEMIVISFMVGAMIAIGKMGIRKIHHMPVYVPGETMNFSIPIGIGVLIVLGIHKVL